MLGEITMFVLGLALVVLSVAVLTAIWRHDK